MARRNPLDRFFTTAVSVETFTGTDGRGRDQFADAQTVMCMVEFKNTLTRTADGEQATSTVQVYAPLAAADAFVPNSRVTLDGTDLPRVISTSVLNVPGLPLPAHTLVALG